MSVTDCAEIVQRGDPDRYAATMAAPPAARDILFPLYALNLEIARAPWSSAEPMVAEMRLQWWIDTLSALAEGRNVSGPPVVMAVGTVLARDPRVSRAMIDLAEARRRDCWPDPFEGKDDLLAYLDATAGNLMWAAALTLGAEERLEPAIRDAAMGGAIAAYLRAVPHLVARDRQPLPDDSASAIAGLAAKGLARLDKARRIAFPPEVMPALWTVSWARQVLKGIVRDPARVGQGRAEPSEFARRLALLWRVLRGRV